MSLFDRDCPHGMDPITCRICNPPPSYPWPDPNAAADKEIASLRAKLEAAEERAQGDAETLGAAMARVEAAERERDDAQKQRDGCRSDASRMGELWERAVKDWKAAEAERDAARAEAGALRAVLGTVLDSVDYMTGACGPTEMVAAVLPMEILTRARALAAGKGGQHG